MLICETPEPQNCDQIICPEVIDFGIVFLERPVVRKIECVPGTIFESELRDIVYFNKNEQELCCRETEVQIWLKANRLGMQEKYITVSLHH